jgi:predicted N-acyltransferase
MELRVVRGVREVAPAAWDALVGDAGSPFVEWAWLATMEDSGAATGETGWLPQHLTAWDGGRLVGACPLYVKGHSMGEFVFDHSWATAAERAGIRYYPKLLVGVPFTPVTGDRFLVAPDAPPGMREVLVEALEEVCGRQGFSSAHIDFCRPEDAAVLEGRGWLRRVGYQYHWTNDGFTTFDDYLASLRSKRRNQTRRERRELAQQGVEITAHTGDEIPDALFPRMFRLYRMTIDRLTWGRPYLDESFFTMAAARLRPRLVLIVARHAGEVIAATFNVRKRDVLYGRYWGVDRELRHLHFNVCYYAAIDYCVTHGLRRFEPGAGGEFKHLRGFDVAATESRHLIRDPHLRDAIRDFLVRERRAVRREMAWLDERSALRREPPGPAERPEEP